MRRISTLLAVALMFVLAACGSSAKTNSPSSSTQAGGSINVLAGSSLTKGFTALGEQFETAHPGSHVNFSFASSSTLADADPGRRARRRVRLGRRDQHEEAVEAAWSVGNADRLRQEPAGDRGEARQPEEHQVRSPTSPKSASSSRCARRSAPCGKYADQVLEQARGDDPTPTSHPSADVKATLRGCDRRRRRGDRVRDRRKAAGRRRRPSRSPPRRT